MNVKKNFVMLTARGVVTCNLGLQTPLWHRQIGLQATTYVVKAYCKSRKLYCKIALSLYEYWHPKILHDRDIAPFSRDDLQAEIGKLVE